MTPTSVLNVCVDVPVTGDGGRCIPNNPTIGPRPHHRRAWLLIPTTAASSCDDDDDGIQADYYFLLSDF